MLSPGHLAEMFGVHPTTIHRRTTRLAWALSETAAPEVGAARQYNARDVAIMERLDEYLRQNLTMDEAEGRLRGDVLSGDFEGAIAYPLVAFSDDSGETHEIAPIDVMRGRLALALSDAAAAKARADELDKQVVKLETRIEKLEARAEDATGLRVQLAEAQTELRILKENAQTHTRKPPRWWQFWRTE